MSRARELADLSNVINKGANLQPNLIINGDMSVAQRGTSFTAQTNEFVVDRFNYNQSSSATMDLEQSSDAPDGFSNSAKLTVNAVDSSIGSTDYSQFIQKIEGKNIAHLNWGSSSAKTVTLSFWVKCSVAGDWPLRLVNSNGSKAYAFYFTIDAANTWEYKTKTIEGPTDGTFLTTNGNGVELGIGFATGSTYAGATADQWNTVSGYVSSNLANNTGWIGTTNNTFQITGVSLVVGDTAPFTHPYESYAQNLQRCQRYYKRISTTNSSSHLAFAYGLNYISTIFLGGLNFSPEMRTVPSFSTNVFNDTSFVIVRNNNTSTVSSMLISGTGASVRLNAASSSLTAGDGSYLQLNDAGSYVDFDAEL